MMYKRDKQNKLENNLGFPVYIKFHISFSCFFPARFLQCTHVCVCSVVSGSLKLHGLQPARLLCPWDFPGKNTGVGCRILLQGIFPTLGSNLRPLSPALAGFPLSHLGSPFYSCSVAQLCPTLCDSMNSSTPGFPVLHHLLELLKLMLIESVMLFYSVSQ